MAIDIRETTDKQLILQIQERLQSLGYLKSPIDGVAGKDTISAFVQFKKDNHLEYPFAIGETTLNKLNKAIKLLYELTPRRLAFLNLIAYTEGTDKNYLDNNRLGYDIMFGGGRFSNNYANHPYKVIHAGGYSSSAAGRYQFLDKTWNICRSSLNLKDFSPYSQDMAALWLIHKRGGLQHVDSGKLWNACLVSSWEWASLPPSRYGQPIIEFDKCLSIYNQIYRSLL